MKLIYSPNFRYRLLKITNYIAKDKIGASQEFKKGLKSYLEKLSLFPYMGQSSRFYTHQTVRELVYKGYTIIYEIEPDAIKIVDIFKWQIKEDA